MASPLKRKAEKAAAPSLAKKQKMVVPEYHTAPQRHDETGQVVWPARKQQIERAREIIKECADAQKPTVILPDKDADGLSSGAVLHHTLTSLGLSPDLISVYFPPKGSNVHDDATKAALTELSPAYVFVLDQGSRKGAALLDLPHTCLIVDHHFAEEGGFPEGAEYVTAHDCPPVATTSLLIYHICLPLHLDLADKISWLAAMGTHGDLGTTLKWQPPFPDMTATFKRHPKKAINDAVGLVNAPRRSAAYNVRDAWDAVISASSPDAIKTTEKLHDAAFEVRRETERCTHTAPKFSADATICVLTISSAAQIHPVIATRWAGHLKSNKLEIVMCANEGYLPDKVNFSCRIAKVARGREGDEKVNIIKRLEGIVEGHPELRERLGESFARGHKEASGGIVGKKEWDELKVFMGLDDSKTKKKKLEKENGTATTTKKMPAQKNTLANYFAKA
ncbi:uncharacterized protein EKO05_0008861 [Ascochyta rabiei]|uniref:DDH domain-containing protein n=1 Tax=Didymella rabiei TaxID=5454 RepID=A0A163AR90_DIDRA|nr:uncharacterized protein EKO05_0008861 [Ascochyta rabiei]KZM21339.1 hypothetical protein ST47_g7494 [Ascochyta rabiei]UPX18567.1 hypothetical protein EKO05_0008861 [Ascochyta rabiei]